VVERRMIVYTLAFFLIFLIISIGNSHAQVRVQLVDTPNVIDSSRQNTLEVKGTISGADPQSIVIFATWYGKKTENSPQLQKDERGLFKHTFSLGGERCGLGRFEARVRVSNVVIASEPEYTFVDCELPKISIDKPADGQFIKPHAPVPIELKVEDDMLSIIRNLPSEIHSGRKYTLKVEVDGSPVQTQDIPVLALGQAPVRKFNIPGLQPGQHAIRFSITDPSGKSDEKTIFVKADGTPPSIGILSPGNNDRITFRSGSVPSLTITAEPTDESGIDRVEFYVNGQGVGVANTPSSGNRYTKTVGISEEGQKTITVKAFDKMGNASQKSVTIFVNFEGKPKTVGPVPSPSKTVPGPQKTLPR